MKMIGILCTDDRQRRYSSYLHRIVTENRRPNDSHMIVFSVSDVDFKNRIVSGAMVSGENIRRVKAPIPPVIYNFSLQKEKKNIKKLRNLAGLPYTSLVNGVNKFDQSMIMEMLLSSRDTAAYVLPFAIYDKEEKDFTPEYHRDYLVMPSRGSSISRVILAEQNTEGGRISGSQYFRQGHICDYIDASLCQKRWIFIAIPAIMTHNRLPLVVRSYVQGGKNGEWTVLTKSVYPSLNYRNAEASRRVDEASIEIIDVICSYIPDIGVNYIDFILDNDGYPHFLHFGGFDYRLLYNRGNKNLNSSFYTNMLYLAGYLCVARGGQ